jgi:hypothetical protein
VPAWMFDQTACPESRLLAAQPYVSIEALAALSALLDLALKNQTPSVVLLSGASGASHHQNRGETHVTRDEKLRERIPTQSTIAPDLFFRKATTLHPLVLVMDQSELQPKLSPRGNVRQRNRNCKFVQQLMPRLLTVLT